MAHLRTDSEQQRDFQAKIQRMVSLQHEEQNQSQSGFEDGEEDGDFGGAAAEEKDPRGTIGGLPKRTTTEMMSLNTLGNAGDPGPFFDSSRSGAGQSLKAPWPSESVLEGLPPPSPQQGIGRGTMFFSSNYNPNHRRMSSGDQLQGMISIPTTTSQQPPPPPQQQHQQQQPQEQPFPPRQIYAGYGALGTTALHPHGDLPLQEDQGAQLQEHEFHYGNPDFQNPYGENPERKQRYRPEDSICAKFCCLYAPIANLLLQENVHRSFCFGSIDGLLTGSGIVSAFCAIQVLSAHAEWEVRLAVLAFTTAACVADAVCMAIGHVWTSFIVSSGHAQERSRERQQLDANKGDAKARLVDMLLARGMLKIDAMSLADTLEGYPDMFVSALVGDSLLAGADFAEDETEDGNQQPMLPLGVGGRVNDGSLGRSFDSWKFPSYGQFNEIDHEPETGNVNVVIKESQVEGFFMMFGFAIFAVIPSILWLVLPFLVVPEPHKVHIESSMATDEAGHTLSSSGGGQVISLPSLVVSISGLMMWFLGVWKSRFMDSNWIMSGIENVVVLLACVISAYGVGFAFCYAIGGNEGLTLTNVVESRI